VKLVNEFRVPVSPAAAWAVLTDVERVAPCIPGAQLLSVDGDDFTAAVKVKVGPITMSYKGEASFQEKDQGAQRVVIKANGKETRGNGNAAALVTAQLQGEGDATRVLITTDLTISGKAAQFGRSVLADVAGNLIAQFAERLEESLGTDVPAGVVQGGVTPETDSSTSQLAAVVAADDDDSVDLLKVVAVPMARRVAPIAAGLAAGVVAGFLLGRATAHQRARP
jgi:carbon monoxide dehydrogenase subunit G